MSAILGGETARPICGLRSMRACTSAALVGKGQYQKTFRIALESRIVPVGSGKILPGEGSCARYSVFVAVACMCFAIAPKTAKADDSLADIFNNVRSNERLYANLEIELIKTYHDESPDTNLGKTVAKDYSSTMRYIVQDKYTYYNIIDRMTGADDSSSENKRVAGDDGELTRLVHGTVVNFSYRER